MVKVKLKEPSLGDVIDFSIHHMGIYLGHGIYVSSSSQPAPEQNPNTVTIKMVSSEFDVKYIVPANK